MSADAAQQVTSLIHALADAQGEHVGFLNRSSEVIVDNEYLGTTAENVDHVSQTGNQVDDAAYARYLELDASCEIPARRSDIEKQCAESSGTAGQNEDVGEQGVFVLDP